ncbi:MAG: CPBP family intramembrane glutamic endopeptidase [Planctomycetota bacterium]
MELLVAGLVGFTMLVIFLVFLGSWYRARRRVRRYQKAGLLAGGVFLGLEVLILILLSLENTQPPILFVLILDVIGFIKIVAFTIMGVYFSAEIGLASFPLLMGNPQPANPLDAETDGELDGALGTASNTHAEASEEGDHEPMLQADEQELPSAVQDPQHTTKAVELKEVCLATLCVVAAGGAYSAALFLLTRPTLSQAAKAVFGGNPDTSVSPSTLLAVAAIAFGEEIIFRLGIQNWFAYKCKWTGEKYWIAITLSTVIWTLAHVGTLEPEWVKLLQVFPFGIALGVLYKKYGAESAIAAHVLFNLILTPLGNYFINMQ